MPSKIKTFFAVAYFILLLKKMLKNDGLYLYETCKHKMLNLFPRLCPCHKARTKTVLVEVDSFRKQQNVENSGQIFFTWAWFECARLFSYMSLFIGTPAQDLHLTYTDLIIGLCISDTFKLELLQRLGEALNSERQAWGGKKGIQSKDVFFSKSKLTFTLVSTSTSDTVGWKQEVCMFTHPEDKKIVG